MNGTRFPRTRRILDYLSLAKPRIVLMSVLMTAGGWALASNGAGDLFAFLAGLIGTALAVGSANALNMVWERKSDARMERTCLRPLPAGRIAAWPAGLFGVAIGIAGLALLLSLRSALPAALAAASLLIYVFAYTPLKQITPLALVVGAIPGAAPPLIGWTAATHSFRGPGLLLFAIVLAWQVPHFLAIALFRSPEYARAGIRTVPIVYGETVARWQALVWCGALLPISFLLGAAGRLGGAYWIFSLAAGAIFLGMTLAGFAQNDVRSWARRYFLVSLAYLPLLSLGLALDRFFR